MKYETTQTLVDLASVVSQDPDKADWFDVEDLIENLPNPASVLRDLIQYMHQEFL